MTRLMSDSFSGVHQFPYATVTTDLFKKEDVQVLALATNDHDHTIGLGHQIPTGGIVDGAITGAKINLGAVNLGGDLTGTLAAGHVKLANGSAIQAISTNTQVHSLLALAGDDNTCLYNAGGGLLRFLNQAGTVELGHWDNVGTFQVNGTLICAGANITIGAATSHTKIASDGSNLLSYTDVGAVYVRSANGFLVQDFAGTGWTPINCASLTCVTGSVTLQAAGAIFQLGTGNCYWQNNAGKMATPVEIVAPSITTNSVTIAGGGTIDSGPAGYVRIPQLTVTPGTTALAGATVNGNLTVTGSVNFSSTGTFAVAGAVQSGGIYNFGSPSVSIVWDGTYLRFSHSIIFNTTGNQIVWPNGSYISGNAGYVQGSQASLKENVTPIPDSEATIRVANPAMVVSSYNWPGDTRQSLGFLAENVATVLPQYVIKDEGGNPTGYVPQELTAILWAAVRDLIGRVTALEAV